MKSKGYEFPESKIHEVVVYKIILIVYYYVW